MKKFILVATVSALAGCASNFNAKNSPNNVSEQVLKTDITEENVQIESSCHWYIVNKQNCRITKVTATGTSPSNGGTTVNRNVAVMRACDYARANVAQLFNSRVMSNRVSKTIAEAIEKNGGTALEEDETSTQKNNRTNSNNTSIVTRYTVQVQASKDLRGYRVVKQEVVGDQEVSCTIQYDEALNRSLSTLH